MLLKLAVAGQRVSSAKLVSRHTVQQKALAALNNSKPPFRLPVMYGTQASYIIPQGKLSKHATRQSVQVQKPKNQLKFFSTMADFDVQVKL